MIQKIGVEENINSLNVSSKRHNNPSFKGVGAAFSLLQACEKMPMVNVAVIDMLSAILPRTIVESMTNVFAGFEAFRRESSGLIVNCMTPGIISMGVAALLNKHIMSDGAKMSTCLADSSLIENATKLYTKSTSKDKMRSALKELFENIEGYDGDKKIKFKDVLSKSEINEYISQYREIAKKDLKRKELEKEVDKISQKIAEKTHVYENLSVVNKAGKVEASNITSLMKDSIKFFSEFEKASAKNPKLLIEDFAKQSKKLVKGKTIGGFLIVLPLAASMQFINRWITNRVSGVKGAPIYEDYATDNATYDKNAKEGLTKQKIISIASMLAVGFLSMMKVPKWNMFEFKGIFPSMDQARLISTTTFASRMAAADDKNELREATIRDIATFISLYFLGDYAAKGAATIFEKVEKKKGNEIHLLNDTKVIDKNANIFKKFWHWFKDIKLKSSEEVISISKTAKELESKGLTPNKEQAEKIATELAKGKNLRSAR
ncbi:MAG: hypothetical protein MJ231_04470, partial [bacterium]|nr:hypothetical protein [bacterium]